jgi:hypothetical protein
VIGIYKEGNMMNEE